MTPDKPGEARPAPRGPVPRDLMKMLSRAVSDGPGQEIGLRAVEAGLITPDQLRDCEAEAVRRPGEPFRNILQQRLGLPPATLDSLEVPVARKIAGRYELRREIGHGAMGVVHLAWDLQLRREVAIKFIRPGRETNPELLQRIQREARAIARLKHPGIPVIHDTGIEGELTYLVMEYVEGRTLAEEIADGPLPAGLVAVLGEQIARALDHAHAQGVVHRDIKPSNIKIDPAGEPHVLDFGLVQLMGGEEAMTRSGAAVGTPYYMAPEQVRGDSGRIDGRTDVYGLAATLYECVTGTPPFPGTGVAEIFERIQSTDPIRPRALAPSIPPDLETILLKALSKEPHRRYSRASAFADDLRRHREGEAILARGSSITYRVWKRFRRRPVAWVLGSIAVVALGALAMIAIIQTGKTQSLSEDRIWDDLALQISGAHQELQEVSGTAMSDLEDGWYGRPIEGGAEPRLVEIGRAVAHVRKKFPDARLPGAWEALAIFFARGNEGMKRLERAASEAGDDPYPHLFQARALVAVYLARMPQPRMAWPEGHVLIHSDPESPDQRSVRESMAAAVLQATKTRGWTRLRIGPESLAYAEGIRSLGEGQWEQALHRLERAGGAAGGAGIAAKGLALFRLGKFVEAARTWESLAGRGWVKSLVMAAFARISAGSLLQAAGENPGAEFGQAERNIQDALRLHPAQPLGQGLLGDVLAWLMESDSASGRDPEPHFKQAIAAYEKSISLDPSRPAPWNGLGLLWGQRGQQVSDRGGDPLTFHLKALEMHRAAEQLHPPSAWSYLAGTRLQLAYLGEDRPGNLRGAKAMADRAVEQDPNDAPTRINRARIHLELAPEEGGSHIEDAIRDVRIAVGVAPDSSTAHEVLGLAWIMSGNAKEKDPRPDYEKAVDPLTTAIAKNPRNYGAWLHRGVAHLLMGNLTMTDPKAAEHYRQAETDFRRALEILPHRADAHSNLGLVLENQGRIPEAIASFEKALNIRPDLDNTRSRLEMLKARKK